MGLFKKVQRFIKREFELNQRQANVFLLLSIIFLNLIIYTFYRKHSEESRMNYSLKYFLDDSVAVVKVEKFVLKNELEKKEKKFFEKSTQPISHLGDLNLLTALDLQKVSGVGEVLSSRIVKFRDKLGGFYSQDQLYEVYGLDSVVVLRIKESTTLSVDFKKVEVNLFNYEDFNSHPYLSWKQASALVKMRREKIFLNEEDVQGILDSISFQRIVPYLSF